MSRPTQITIDLPALKTNLRYLRQCAPHSRILAMVKADAYGHGIVTIARALRNVDGFGVACLEEALHLREVGIKQKIVLMEGVFSASELFMVEKYRLDLVVHSDYQLRLLTAARFSQPIQVWLKINTGMNRLGFAPAEVQSAWQVLHNCKNVAPPPYLMSHYACADERDDVSVAKQTALFDEATQGLTGPKSLANSAAVFSYPESQRDWVRPGLSLYGISPFKHWQETGPGLVPVMTLESQIIAIQHCPRGSQIGYGGRYTCAKDSLIGIVPLGYGDGYPRHAIDGTPVWVHGREVPLVGCISMDMLTVDLTALDDPQIGDRVVLWGPEMPIERVAENANTIPYELVCNVTKRVRRLIKE